jgi:hypothetical protein
MALIMPLWPQGCCRYGRNGDVAAMAAMAMLPLWRCCRYGRYGRYGDVAAMAARMMPLWHVAAMALIMPDGNPA